jgi:hypothetical protein
MNLSHRTRSYLLCGLAGLAAACSSGGDGGGSTATGTFESSVQDLDLDPNGTTTVLSFSRAPLSVDPSYFSADGGQSAQSATLNGVDVTVVWDARVSPSHTISVSGLPGIVDGTSSPSTTDASAPTFTITASAMNSGLGADTLEVTFSGPRVDEAVAEDPASWTLAVGGTPMDLTGSSFDLDPGTQVLDITLGSEAALHSTFTLAAASVVSVADTAVSTTPVGGNAAGDAVAPTLTSVTQNLGEDEFGRVIDLTFSEAMSPTFSESIGNFLVAGNPATAVDQPVAGVLRVTFNQPVIPGVDTVTPSNMMDVHGNPVALGAQAVTQPSPVANAYDSSAAVTVANVGGDHVTATFDQAFDAAEAIDPTNWTLTVDGNPVVMTDQTFGYDFLNKTLTIDLDFDMVNGTAYTLTGVSVLEVDGESFSLAAAGTVGGDVTAPTVTSVVQNRTQDPTGQTLDVTFSEDLDAAAVSTLPNWTVNGGPSVTAGTLLGSPNIVRLTLTGGAAIPGIVTLDVAGQADLAGNPMAPSAGIAITSTDAVAPSMTLTSGQAPAGADNDTVTVTFDDDMVEAQVEDPANWAIESPVGTSFDTTGASVDYNPVTRSATLTFDAGNGVHFEQGNGFRVTLSAMQDIGANAVGAGSLDGSITFESGRPWADFAWREAVGNIQATVRFSEHMADADDLYDFTTNPSGVRYIVRDSGGALRGMPLAATATDGGLGVQLDFGFVLDPNDTIDVIGARDLVGNFMYPVLALPLPAEDASEPDFGVQGTPLLAVSGERNDVIELVFDRELSPWGVTDPSNYTITDGTPLDLEQATFAFDGDRTVTITLDGGSPDSLQAASSYDITVDGLRSAQGVEMSAASTLPGVAVSGDTAVAPLLTAAGARIDRSYPNAVLVFADEALDPTTAEDESRWSYQGGTTPTSAVLVDPTTVRLSFPVNPVAGNVVWMNLVDLAGNVAGAASASLQAFETVPPALVSVSGTAVPGEGGDHITVTFNEPVDRISGLNAGNYAVTNGGVPFQLTSAGAWYDSTSYSTRIFLAPGYEFDAALPIQVTVQNIEDHSSNAMAGPVSLGGVVGGDTATPPGVVSAFTNYQANAFGLFVDVLFDEAPDPLFVSDPFNWSVTGGGLPVVLGVTRLGEDEYRVSLSTALGSGEELEIAAGLMDLAGNAAVAATPVTVVE